MHSEFCSNGVFFWLDFRNTRAPAWSNNQPDYSSLSDSQFLFGSQFCPENTETLAAPLDFGTHLRQHKQTQQAPLDVGLMGRISVATRHCHYREQYSVGTYLQLRKSND